MRVERAQIDHVPIGVEIRVEAAAGRVRIAHDLPAGVDRVGVAVLAAQRPEVRLRREIVGVVDAVLVTAELSHADDLPAIVDGPRVAVDACQSRQVAHRPVAEKKGAVGERTGDAHHLSTRVNSIGDAANVARQGAQIGHRAVLVEKCLVPAARVVGRAHYLSTGVDANRSAGGATGKQAKVGQGPVAVQVPRIMAVRGLVAAYHLPAGIDGVGPAAPVARKVPDAGDRVLWSCVGESHAGNQEGQSTEYDFAPAQHRTRWDGVTHGCRSFPDASAASISLNEKPVVQFTNR